MTHDLINTFLAVIEYGSISKAAKYLYSNQSNVSKKIQQLEEELGVKLLIRSRGHRNIELTSRGKDFFVLAQKFNVLWQDIQSIKETHEYKSLSIGSINLLNTFSFVQLYKTFIKNNPFIQVSIHTYHSSEISHHLEEHNIDLGFSLSPSRNPNIISTLIYEENYCLLCRNDSMFKNVSQTQELIPEREIYLRWGAEYEHWHETNFPGKKYRMRAGTGSMLADFFDIDDGDFWAVAPIDAAKHLLRNHDLSCNNIFPSPPALKCYMLENNYVRESRRECIKLFKQSVMKYIEGKKADINNLLNAQN